MSSLDSTLDNNATTSAVSARSGQSAGQFAASFITAVVIFSVQVLAFLLIKDRLARIYQPRTYLVPERERTKPVAPGWFKWIKPVLATSNSEFVQKCGLDAYFFLRYLRTLLKIFIPATLVILPILLPINAVGGKGTTWGLTHPNEGNVTGLDQLSWSNVSPYHTGRFWAHWILALMLVVWVCYISFDELRNYIRMRQAYLTSPQHRLRASATTVLVSSIPEKWLSVEALEGLYDVFPGGLRNIWINRNFDELNDKVHKRDKLARKLEEAETELIKKCFKKHQEDLEKKAKSEGKQISKDEIRKQQAIMDERGREKAEEAGGIDSGNPHQVKHSVAEAVGEDDEKSISRVDIHEQHTDDEKSRLPVPGALSDGYHAVSHGLTQVGRGILDGFRGVNNGVNQRLDTTNGFVTAPTSQIHLATHHTQHDVDGSHEDSPQADLGDSNATDHHYKTLVYNATPTSIPEPTGHRQPGMTANDTDLNPTKTPESPGYSDQGIVKKSEAEEKPSTWQKIEKVVGLGGDDEAKIPVAYKKAFNEEYEKDDGTALWRKYLTEKDRDTMRLPIFGWEWMFSMPLIGQKVDTIYHCRKEVARLNVEIEDDQAHPDRFPLMTSAFIQFNHQVAAHMACQSLSHHLPKQMAPRIVEIDPNDVIWDNMSIPWWQVYVRTAAVFSIVVAMIILWAIPVAFTSALSQLSSAAANYQWLHWILNLPSEFISVLQGVLSPALLALLLFLLPVILRFLASVQGIQSGMLVELSVQKYYFFFLFIQVFLVSTVSSAAVTIIGFFKTADGFTHIPGILGQNIPKASNYFISYMILQALSTSAGALVQVGGLLSWFVFAPLFDKTARDKFMRQTQLSDIQWGTFFPVYTNLACIGLIYSVVSPLILIFNILTFGLFWFVYRYQTLYVTRFTKDTGGLLYPNAINSTFIGLYVMELGLIGLFFIAENEQGQQTCIGQGIGMIVILILTGGYQFLLNEAFKPLFQYLPITLEDDAVRRDEEFARALRIKHDAHQHLIENENDDDDIEDQLEAQERASLEENQHAETHELKKLEAEQERAQARKILSGDYSDIDLQNPEVKLNLDTESKGYRIMRRAGTKATNATQKTADATLHKIPGTGIVRHPRSTWADRGNLLNTRSSHWGGQHENKTANRQGDLALNATNPSSQPPNGEPRRRSPQQHQYFNRINNFNPITGDAKDLEAQQQARDDLAQALFSEVNDELEDLSHEQRDALVQRAFQHAALRSRRPVIWIPRDDLGVSDNEIAHMANFSKNLWVSNVRQGLDGKGRCVYSGAPPDFSEVEIIRL